MANKAILEIGARLAGGTKEAFKSISEGFKLVAEGMRTTATSLAKLGDDSASKALNATADALRLNKKELDGHANAISKDIKNLSQHAKGSEEAKKATAMYASELDSAGKVLKEASKSSDKSSKSIKKLGDTSRAAGSDLRVVKEALVKLSDSGRGSQQQLEFAASSSKKLGKDVIELAHALTTAGHKGKEWAETLKYETIVQERANGALDKRSQGLGKLTVEGMKAIGLDKDMINSMRKLMESQSLYNAALEKARAITDKTKRAEQVALIEKLGAAYGKANVNFSAFTIPLKNIDDALARLNQNIKSKGVNALYEFTKGLDKTKIAMATLNQNIKISGDGITIYTRAGLKAMGDMSVKTAKQLDLLSKDFRALIDTEIKLSQVTGQSIKTIRKQNDEMHKQGSTNQELVATMKQTSSAYTKHQTQITDTVRTYGHLTKVQGDIGKGATEQISKLKSTSTAYKDVIAELKNYAAQQKAVLASDKAKAKLIEANRKELGVFKARYVDLLQSETKYADHAKRMIRNFNVSSEKIKILGAVLSNLNRKYGVTERATSALAEKVMRLRLQYEPLIATHSRAGLAASRLIAKFEKGKKTYEDTVNSLRRLTSRTDVFRTAIDRLAKSFRTYLSYQVVSNVIMGVRQSFAAATATVIEYDQALKDLQAITQATTVEVEMMGETVLKVAASTKFSATEVAVGMKTLGQAGFTAKEAIEAIQGVSDLATGTLTDMKTAVDLVSTAIRVFHLDASEASHVSDVFANAVNGSKLTVDKLRIAMNYIGPVAKLAGVSFEDLSSTMMLLANQGIRASTIGTGLRQVFSKILKPTDDFKNAVKEAGLTMDDLNPKMNSMRSVIGNLGLVIKDADDAFRFFGMRGAAAVAALAGSSVASFDNMRGLVDRTGIAAKMAAQQMEGLGVMFKNISDKVGVLTVKFSATSGLTAVIRKFGEATKKVLSILIELSDSAFVSVISKTIALTVAITSLVVVWRLLAATMLSTKFAAITGSIAHFTGATIVSVRAVDNLKLAFLGLTRMNPLIMGLTAAAAAAFFIWSKFKKGVTTEELRDQAGQISEVTDELSNYESKLESVADSMEDAEESSYEYIQLQKEHKRIVDDIITKYPELANKFNSYTEDIKAQTEALRALNAEKRKEQEDISKQLAKKLAKELKEASEELAEIKARKVKREEFYAERAGTEQVEGRQEVSSAFIRDLAKVQELNSDIAALTAEWIDTVKDLPAGAVEIPEILSTAYIASLTEKTRNYEKAITDTIRNTADSVGLSIDELQTKLTESLTPEAGKDIISQMLGDEASKKAFEDFQAGLSTVIGMLETAQAEEDMMTRVPLFHAALAEYKQLMDDSRFAGEVSEVRALLTAMDTHNKVLNDNLKIEKELRRAVDERAAAKKALPVDATEDQIVEAESKLKNAQLALSLHTIKVEAIVTDHVNKMNKIASGIQDPKDMLVQTREYLDKIEAEYERAKAKAVLAVPWQDRAGILEVEKINLDFDVTKASKKIAHVEEQIKAMQKMAESGNILAESASLTALRDELLAAQQELRDAKVKREKGEFRINKALFNLEAKLARQRAKGVKETADAEIKAVNESLAQREISEVEASKKRENIAANERDVKITFLEEIRNLAAYYGLDEEVAKANAEIAKAKGKALGYEVAHTKAINASIDALRALAVEQERINSLRRIADLEYKRDESTSFDVGSKLAAQRSIGEEKLAQIDRERRALNELAIQNEADPVKLNELVNKKIAINDAYADQERVNKEELLKLEIKFSEERLSQDLWTNEERMRLYEEAGKLGIISQENMLQGMVSNSDDFLRQLVFGIHRTAGEVETLGESVINIGAEMFNSLGTGLTEAFIAIADGSKSAKDAFSDFASDFLEKIRDMIIQTLVLKALKAALGGTAIGGFLGFGEGGKVEGKADGGRIGGSSPHPKADNIPIMATQDEFMQPVSAVKYYGLEFMEAIRKRLIPKGLFEGMKAMSSITVPKSGTANLANGGPVSQQVNGGDLSISVPVSIKGSGVPAKMAAMLQEGIEDTVRNILQQELA